MNEPLDTAELRAKWGKVCPSCDAGLPMLCVCSCDDPRGVILALCDALDQAAAAGERIARAIEARKRPGITAMLEGGWNHAIETAAGVARETAGNGPERHATAREGQGAIGGKHAPSGLATADDRDDRQEQ